MIAPAPPLLLLLGRTAWTAGIEPPPGWRRLAWPIGPSGQGAVGVVAREPLAGWFVEYRGFPDGIGPVNGPLELLEVPETGAAPKRLAVVCRLDDWEAIAVLPGLLARAPFSDVPEVDVWLVAPELDQRGGVFASARELNALATRPSLRRVAWFVVERPERVTGLTAGVAAVVEILAAEDALREAGGATIPRERSGAPGAAAALVRGAGAATLESSATVWSGAFGGAALQWLASRLPGALANSDLVPAGDLREAWATIWGWDPVPWKWVPRWLRSRGALEGWMAERLWVGSGWSRALEDAFGAPVLEFVEALAARGTLELPSQHQPDGFDQSPGADEPSQPVDVEGDQPEASARPSESAALLAVRQVLADARRLAAELPRLGRSGPLPDAFAAMEAEAGDGYGRFLHFKTEELGLRLAAQPAGAAWPDEAELLALAQVVGDGLEDGWPALAARLEPCLRDAALHAEEGLVQELAAAWTGLSGLIEGSTSAAHASWRPGVTPVRVWDVVLRWVLGARSWSDLWRGVVEGSLGRDGGVLARWRETVERVEELTEDRWLELAEWGGVLEALVERGDVPREFWDLAGSRGRLAARGTSELARLADEATRLGARRRVELLQRAMEPRVRLAARALEGGGASVRVERPAHLDPALLQAVAPRAEVVVPPEPAPGRLAVAISWTDPQPFVALRVCADAARIWRRRHADPAAWQPLPVDQEPEFARVALVSRRAAALALVEALRAGVAELADPVGWVAARTRALVASPLDRDAVEPPEMDELRSLLEALPDDAALPLRGGGPTLVERILRETPGSDDLARLLYATRTPRSSPWAALLPR